MSPCAWSIKTGRWYSGQGSARSKRVGPGNWQAGTCCRTDRLRAGCDDQLIMARTHARRPSGRVRGRSPCPRRAGRANEQKRPEPCARKAATDRIAVLWDAGRSIGDMWTNAQPASRNERITWITSPSCRTAIGRPQRRKTFSMERLRESTSASSRSRPFTRAMAII
jgi:hypothetical protein